MRPSIWQWFKEILLRNGRTAFRVWAQTRGLQLISMSWNAASNVWLTQRFALHNGHLELSEIASKRLSTCHTAGGLDRLPREAMHLVGGLQFAGFPSVIIPMMWGVRDTDTAFVSSQVYQYLFRNKVQSCDPSEAVTALNQAGQRLRETHSSLPVDRSVYSFLNLMSFLTLQSCLWDIPSNPYRQI